MQNRNLTIRKRYKGLKTTFKNISQTSLIWSTHTQGGKQILKCDKLNAMDIVYWLIKPVYLKSSNKNTTHPAERVPLILTDDCSLRTMDTRRQCFC
jgi:hypothetical protein